MLSKQEQRELLLLQCDLARVKLRCTQQQAAPRKQAAQAKSGVVWQLADAAGEAVRHADGLKLAMLPAKWKHRAAVLLGLMALEWAERRATGKRGR